MDVRSYESSDETCCDSGHEDSHIGFISSQIKRRTKYPSGTSLVIAAQTIVILLLGASLTISIGKGQSYSVLSLSCPPSVSLDVGIISPAREGVRFLEKSLYNHGLSVGPYRGRPSADIDTAWADLTRPFYLRVTKIELDAANVTAMESPNGDHVSGLNVYHHLHCLRAIKRYIYAPYYHPDVPVEQIRTESYGDHLDHCVELLRDTIMCQPDFSLSPFQWEGDNPKFATTNGETSHQCVDWDYFERWTKGRAFDVQEIKDYWTLVTGTEFLDS